jgi:hypothetical protein
MSSAVDPILVLILMLNFLLLGTSRMGSAINASAMQGALLGVLAVAVHGQVAIRPILLGIAAIAIKGLFIPGMLHRALRDAAIRREIDPYVSFVASLVLGRLPRGLLFCSPSSSAGPRLKGRCWCRRRSRRYSWVLDSDDTTQGHYAGGCWKTDFVMGLTVHDAMPSAVEVFCWTCWWRSLSWHCHQSIIASSPPDGAARHAQGVAMAILRSLFRFYLRLRPFCAVEARST